MFLSFIDITLREFMEELSSSAPTPGGGSVSALAGSLGLSLLTMVLNITLKKSDNESDLEEILEDAEKLKNELTELIDEDSKAFDGVMSAFRLPKETEEQKNERSEKIQSAFKSASEVPYKTAEKCVKGSEIALIVAEKGEKNAISDVGCAVWLLKAGYRGARLNVEINLSSIKDEEFVNKLRKGLDDLSETLEENLSKSLTLVEEGL